MKVILKPSGMYGVGCQECKVPYQYATISINHTRFVCDGCARKMFPQFKGRPSGDTWEVSIFVNDDNPAWKCLLDKCPSEYSCMEATYCLHNLRMDNSVLHCAPKYKNPAAVALGRLGGLANKGIPKPKSAENARKALAARMAKRAEKSSASPDSPTEETEP